MILDVAQQREYVVRLADEAERWSGGRWSESIVIGEELVGVRGDGNDCHAMSVAGRMNDDPALGTLLT